MTGREIEGKLGLSFFSLQKGVENLANDDVELIRDGIEINKDLYPSNADRQPEKEPVKKVAHGVAVRKKRSLRERVHDFLFETGPETAKTYIYEDIVEPAIKDMASDIARSILGGILDSIDMALFGSVRGSRYRRSDRESSYWRSYDDYYDDRDRRRRRDDERYSRERERYSRRSDEAAAKVETHQEAKDLVYAMQDRVHRYDSASVAYFYDIADMPVNPTDEYYGWDLKHPFEARVEHARDGWIVTPTRPVRLD